MITTHMKSRFVLMREYRIGKNWLIERMDYVGSIEHALKRGDRPVLTDVKGLCDPSALTAHGLVNCRS